MIGAIIGDIVGSRFEWNNNKTKKFELFTNLNRYTDDSVMTCAIAQALMDWEDGDRKNNLENYAIFYMQQLGRLYKNVGYGASFMEWVWTNNPLPYNSYGNGSAMRVSPCAWFASTLSEAQELATKVTKVTHNHPEGIKGAVTVVSCIFLAKQHKTKDEIKNYINNNFYKLNFTLDQIRPMYKFDVSCQGSVPQAIECFLESNSFEECLRNAISIGGDSDTIGAIACSIAEAYYSIDKKIISNAINYLDVKLVNVIKRFENYKR